MTILFAILLVALVVKLIVWAVKATWGIFKVIFGIVLFPIAIVGCFAFGLVYVAIVILVIALIGAIIGSIVTA